MKCGLLCAICQVWLLLHDIPSLTVEGWSSSMLNSSESAVAGIPTEVLHMPFFCLSCHSQSEQMGFKRFLKNRNKD